LPNRMVDPNIQYSLYNIVSACLSKTAHALTHQTRFHWRWRQVAQPKRRSCRFALSLCHHAPSQLNILSECRHYPNPIQFQLKQEIGKRAGRTQLLQ
jgi:hypothetical protein